MLISALVSCLKPKPKKSYRALLLTPGYCLLQAGDVVTYLSSLAACSASRLARYRDSEPRATGRTTRAVGALCMEGPSLIRNYHKMGKRKGAYPASSEVAAAGDPNPTARLVLALLLLLVIIAIGFVVWRRARNRGPHCARHPKPRA